MKLKGLFIVCIIFTSTLFAHEGGSFAENHYRFVIQHIPQLMHSNSRKILLIGSFGRTYQMLSKQYPLIEFEELSIWQRNLWDKIIEKRNFNGLFDCVVAMHVLEREPAKEKVLQIISDLLKPGGKALIYIDPQEKKDSLDQRIEQHVRRSGWCNRIPIIPSLLISEYQEVIKNAGLYVLDQSPAQYQIYYLNDFDAFLSLSNFACARWPVPRTDWDEEVFAGEIRGHLRHRHEIIEIPNSPPDFNSWIEDVLPTHYFIIQK